MTFFCVLLAYLEAWNFDAVRPRLEPEVDPVARARRCCMTIHQLQ
jgi:hypothetical protein